MKKIIIGSRGSKLALIQAEEVKSKLQSVGISKIEISVIKTKGDLDKSRAISDIGGKDVFVAEIEKALLSKEIDIAVHSLKDMSASPSSELIIGAFLKGEDSRDVLVGKRLSELKSGSKVGTGSPRRTSQLKILRSDLMIEPIRGNVETRISKVESGEYDSAVLAFAGIKRLGLEDSIKETFSLDDMVPAAGQGVIAVQTRSHEEALIRFLAELDDSEQRARSEIEFALLKEIGATCETPIGIYSSLKNERVILDIFLGSLDSDRSIREVVESDLSSAEMVAKFAVDRLSMRWRDEFGEEYKT